MQKSVTQQGFTLIEVLIAVLIFAVGLLGLAGLQTSGLRTTHNSYLLALATQQAEDMAERMRANPAEAIFGGHYETINSTIPEPRDCTQNTCNTLQLAQHDHYAWTERNADLFGMPGTVSRVERGQQQVFTINVPWTVLNQSGGSASPDKKYTMVFFP